MKKNIVLVGLMGAGKSRVGRELGELLQIPFIDSDYEIEKAAGCSISDIFEVYGERGFRDGEKKVIARLLQEEGPMVLATGGGAFMNTGIRSFIKQNAVSVWLEADLDLLVERTSRTSHRPLLQTGDPREILSRLMKERYPIYKTADISIESIDLPPGETAKKIAKALTAYLEKE